MKKYFLLLLLILASSCGSMEQNSEQLYPSEDLVIQYHSKWTKATYPKRIKSFMEAPLRQGDIVFLGNSITQQGGDWSAKFGRSDVKNRGISGDVTDGVLARLGEICHAKPKAVFLLIGINDIFNWHNEWGIPSPEYVGENIPRIARAIHEGSPRTKIYVQTVLPTDYPPVKDAISTVNTMIKANEKEGHYIVIDLFTAFAGPDSLIKPELTTDGTHLTEAGYQLWVDIVNPLIENFAKPLHFVYPNGATKALVMSYDDGLTDDRRFIDLLDQNGLIGTFNLNSGNLGKTLPWYIDGDTTWQTYLPADSLNDIYKDHEIAAHGVYHQYLPNLSDEDILIEVGNDVEALSKTTDRTIRSFAYAFGGSDERVAELTGSTGLTNARTINDTYGFDLPENFLLWDPTCHDTKALDLLDDYLSLNQTDLSIFAVWGHSWEFRDPVRWQQTETFCQKTGHRDDVWSVGAGDFTAYVNGLRALIYEDDQIINPKGNITLYYEKNGKVRQLKPGKKIRYKL